MLGRLIDDHEVGGRQRVGQFPHDACVVGATCAHDRHVETRTWSRLDRAVRKSSTVPNGLISSASGSLKDVQNRDRFAFRASSMDPPRPSSL